MRTQSSERAGRWQVVKLGPETRLSHAKAQLMISMLFNSQLMRVFETGAPESCAGRSLSGVGVGCAWLSCPRHHPQACCSTSFPVESPPLDVSVWPSPPTFLSVAALCPQSALSMTRQTHWPFSRAPSKLFTSPPGLPSPGVSPPLPSLLLIRPDLSRLAFCPRTF